MVYTVTQISNDIKSSLLKCIPDKLVIEGEISNFKTSNGHMYFTLKDEESAISVVSWGYEKYFNVELRNGDKVQVSGKLTTYSKNGTYSLQIFKVEKQGIGGLHKAYEELKLKYHNKGYFDESIKKQFPENIKNIGIITSPEGAALQDILFVLKKNKFQGNVVIKRCMVQGQSCSKSVAESIEYLNEYKINKKKLDLIMVSRGGGSFEDLMGYSDAKVIEAIYDSDIFVMSAVGHEVDFMLSDFAADLRAPTPSIGAEIISKKQKENIDKFNQLEDYFTNILKTKINSIIDIYKNKLELLEVKNKNPEDNIKNAINKLDKMETYFQNNLEKILNLYSNKVNNLEKNIEKFNMDKVNDFGMVQIFKKVNGNYINCNYNDFNDKYMEYKLIFGDKEVLIKAKKLN